MSLDWSFTNLEEQSCKPVKLECSPFWEYWQQEAIKRMSNLQDEEKNIYKIEPGYEARARRIAAIYAKIFLETEAYGNEKVRGRYYWMGFGAFASKTMGMVFSHFGTAIGFKVGIREAANVFAKGNFWLFMDLAPWHYAWSACPKSFESCFESRDTESFEHLKEVMTNLPWFNDVPIDIRKMNKTKEIENAFIKVKEIESIFLNEPDDFEKYKLAAKKLREQLSAIGDQEQRNILQDLVWKNGSVKFGSWATRWFGWTGALPSTTLVLSSDYDVEAVKKVKYIIVNPETKESMEYTKVGSERHQDTLSQIEDDVYIPPLPETIAEEEDSRMAWINVAANRYHALMSDEKGQPFLYDELKIIAGWEFDQTDLKYIDRASNDGKI